MLKRLFLILFVALALLPAATASAQSCAYAEIRIEATVAFDQNAVCDAAQALDDAGYFVFVYVTDYEPGNEDEWFARLDDVEAETGIRDGSGFQLNAIAIETAITTDETWAHSVTLGDAFLGTSLDSDAGALRVKQPLISAANGGDTSAAVVQALGISAELSAAATSTTSTDSSGSASATPAAESSGVGVAGVAAAVLGLGAVGAAGAVAYPRYKASQAKKKREDERVAHLTSIQERVSNLLLALEQLIDGSTPQESVLYQLFEVYNGNNYEEIDEKVTGLIGESQSALSDVFATRSKLLEDDVIAERGTEQLVADWERIYVTLTGSQERILNLNDKELHTLLDPLLVLEKKPDNSKLAGQLDKLKQSLDGVPLKVELETVDPSTMDEAGILGNVDAVQAEIGRLQHAQTEAPNRLEAAQRERLEADKGDADAPFVVAEADRFVGIDQRLSNAESFIIEGLHLRAIEETELAEDLVDVLEDLKVAESLWDERKTEMRKIEADGFVSPAAGGTKREIADDLANLTAALRDGDPDGAIDWGVEFDADGKLALEQTRAWRDLHLDTSEQLRATRDQFALAESDQTQAAANAWDALQAYPAENWQDLETGYRDGLTYLSHTSGRLDTVASLNTLETQRFDEAAQRLATVSVRLSAAQGQLEAVANRIDEVVSAENSIDAAILQAEKALNEAVALRDADDAKVGASVDSQIAQARSQLAEAREKRDERSFILAIHAQSHSYELSTAAYKSASEQVAAINELQHDVNVFIDDRYSALEQRLRAAADRDAYRLSKGTLEQVRVTQGKLSRGLQTYHAAESKEDSAMAESLREALSLLESAESEAAGLEEKIAQEEVDYREQYDEAEQEIARAERALAEAFQAGRLIGSGSQWKRLAQKAQNRMPRTPARGMTLQQLADIEQQARDAREIAESAEHSAEAQRRSYDRRQRERSMRRTVIPSGGGGWGNTTPGWGSIGGSSGRRSSSRQSSSSPSRRSTGSFGGGSRRGGSSFGGSSRRGGSMGGSSRR